MDEVLKRDQNHITVLGGITDDSNEYVTMLRVDPITKRLLVAATGGGGGGGTVTIVSIVTANGISGSVATATTTPAITLTLGAITPSAVQISGLTASEIVGTDASKNLVSLAVATYPSLTELTYVKGVTSSIQTQINAKGTGTVTSVSVVTANGVSGSVATSTTTPAITITLGAITPTTINGNTITTGTGTLTLGAGSTLVTSATNSITLTSTGATNVTLPTTGTLATLAGAETLSGKTLTAPKFVNGGFIADANGNEMLIFNTAASAVNEVSLYNAATGSGVAIFATGGDTNIDFLLRAKGAGVVEMQNSNTTAFDPTSMTATAVMRFYNTGAGGSAGIILQSASSGDSSSGQAVIASYNEGATTIATSMSLGTREAGSGAIIEKMRLTSLGNIVLGKQAALATNATDGFTYIPTCAGAPSGVPTAYTGKTAMVFDTTNNKLMIYDGGWIGVTLS